MLIQINTYSLENFSKSKDPYLAIIRVFETKYSTGILLLKCLKGKVPQKVCEIMTWYVSFGLHKGLLF
jgi:hypothetical protein